MRQLKLLIAALFLISPFAANAVLITFDDLASGTALTTQYAALGVTFSGTEGGTTFAPEVRNQQFISVPHSGANYLTNFFVPGSTASSDRLDEIIIDFAGLANNVTLWLNTAGTNTIEFDLYDQNDLFAGTVGLVGSGVDNVFQNVGSGIGRMVARQPSDGWWWSLDDLSFDIVAVPEPGTLALLGIGLLGMGAARRRKKA